MPESIKEHNTVSRSMRRSSQTGYTSSKDGADHDSTRMQAPGARCAIILAAGEGKRLEGVFNHVPKGFIEVNGEHLITRSIRMMREQGVCTFIIVAGYAGKHYEDLAQTLKTDQPGIDVHIAHNQAFRTTTTLRSLQIGIQSLHQLESETGVIGGIDSVIIAESDLLYESRATLRLQSHNAENVLLTSGPTNAGDEVYVASQDGRLCGLSKSANTLSGEIIGELVGLTRVSANALAWLSGYSDEHSQAAQRTYEDALTALSAHHPVYCELIQDLVWTEIDNADHLKRATQTIGPWIAESDQMMSPLAADIA